MGFTGPAGAGHVSRGQAGTLRAWFDSDGSADRTGAAVYCHPNIVRYRLRQLQELTRRKLTDPWWFVDLGAALQAVELQRQDNPAC